MKTQKALAVSAPELAAVPAAAFRGRSLLYLGDEFCQNLLPSRAAFGRAAAAFSGRVVLVTPLLSDEAFDGVELIIQKFASPGKKLEVVVNDLGLLHTVRKKYSDRVEVTLGRVLGHRVKVLPGAFAAGLLKDHRVLRAEVDDESLPARFAPFGLRLSFHTPWRYISVTRFCPWERHWPGPCRYTCAGSARKLEHASLPQPLFLRGCSYGVKNGGAPAHPLIDRLVEAWAPGAGKK